jgi:hypothetical protein
MTGTAVTEFATASALETADVVVNFQGLRAIDRSACGRQRRVSG